MEFQRKVEWSAAYDKRSDDPKKNYGIHGMEVRFVLIGERAAIQFVLSTNWQMSHIREGYKRKPAFDGDNHHRYDDGRIMCFWEPTPVDIGYHAREPQYDGQQAQVAKCDYLGGVPCYYDGSGLRAKHFFDVFTDEGEEALWKALEGEYEARFIVGVPVTIGSANFGEMINALKEAVSDGDGA